MNKKITLIGYSGHGLVVGEAALRQGFNLSFYIDKQEVSSNPYKLKYLGYEHSDNFEYLDKECNCILGIGDNLIRKKTAKFFLSKNYNLLNIIHPSVIISKQLEMGTGNFISAKTFIGRNVKVGNFCILNTGSNVSQECILNTAVHVAPGAFLAERVKVGKHSFIGAKSIIQKGIEIGENVKIGAGAVISKNVENNSTIVGNPGRKI